MPQITSRRSDDVDLELSRLRAIAAAAEAYRVATVAPVPDPPDHPDGMDTVDGWSEYETRQATYQEALQARHRVIGEARRALFAVLEGSNGETA